VGGLQAAGGALLKRIVGPQPLPLPLFHFPIHDMSGFAPPQAPATMYCTTRMSVMH
jgi:hypothetical protein